MKFSLLVISCLVALSVATVYFEDDFSSGDFKSNWVVSSFKKSEGSAGEWDLSAGKYFVNEAEEKGLHTTTDARFYAISRKFKEEFSNKDKKLVFQFSAKHDQDIDCGGGYFKLLPAGADLANFGGDTPYNVMFGPDFCGYSHRIVHFILTKKGVNHLIAKKIDAPHDSFTHVYTGVLNADNTYSVYIDGELKQSGSIEEDWNILPPKMINDPAVHKPLDWVDDPMIDDPADVKPADWVDEPLKIDTEAKKPEDWDDELDGTWEPPTIPNPDYKAEWHPRRIDNPAYKGEWVHPQIQNPEYQADPTLYSFDSHSAIGMEIWQVKAGSVFDNFLVTDDLDLALGRAKKITERAAGEKEKKIAAEEAQRAEEEAKRKAEEEANKDEEEKSDL